MEPIDNYSHSSMLFLCNIEKCSLQALKSTMNQRAVHYLSFLWHRIRATTGQANRAKRERENLFRDSNHSYIATSITIPLLSQAYTLLIGLKLGSSKYRVKHWHFIFLTSAPSTNWGQTAKSVWVHQSTLKQHSPLSFGTPFKIWSHNNSVGYL